MGSVEGFPERIKLELGRGAPGGRQSTKWKLTKAAEGTGDPTMVDEGAPVYLFPTVGLWPLLWVSRVAIQVLVGLSPL